MSGKPRNTARFVKYLLPTAPPTDSGQHPSGAGAGPTSPLAGQPAFASATETAGCIGAPSVSASNDTTAPASGGSVVAANGGPARVTAVVATATVPASSPIFAHAAAPIATAHQTNTEGPRIGVVSPPPPPPVASLLMPISGGGGGGGGSSSVLLAATSSQRDQQRLVREYVRQQQRVAAAEASSLGASPAPVASLGAALAEPAAVTSTNQHTLLRGSDAVVRAESPQRAASPAKNRPKPSAVTASEEAGTFFGSSRTVAGTVSPARQRTPIVSSPPATVSVAELAVPHCGSNPPLTSASNGISQAPNEPAATPLACVDVGAADLSGYEEGSEGGGDTSGDGLCSGVFNARPYSLSTTAAAVAGGVSTFGDASKSLATFPSLAEAFHSEVAGVSGARRDTFYADSRNQSPTTAYLQRRRANAARRGYHTANNAAGNAYAGAAPVSGGGGVAVGVDSQIDQQQRRRVATSPLPAAAVLTRKLSIGADGSFHVGATQYGATEGTLLGTAPAPDGVLLAGGGGSSPPLSSGLLGASVSAGRGAAAARLGGGAGKEKGSASPQRGHHCAGANAPLPPPQLVGDAGSLPPTYGRCFSPPSQPCAAPAYCQVSHRGDRYRKMLKSAVGRRAAANTGGNSGVVGTTRGSGEHNGGVLNASFGYGYGAASRARRSRANATGNAAASSSAAPSFLPPPPALPPVLSSPHSSFPHNRHTHVHVQPNIAYTTSVVAPRPPATDPIGAEQLERYTARLLATASVVSPILSASRGATFALPSVGRRRLTEVLGGAGAVRRKGTTVFSTHLPPPRLVAPSTVPFSGSHPANSSTVATAKPTATAASGLLPQGQSQVASYGATAATNSSDATNSMMMMNSSSTSNSAAKVYYDPIRNVYYQLGPAAAPAAAEVAAPAPPVDHDEQEEEGEEEEEDDDEYEVISYGDSAGDLMTYAIPAAVEQLVTTLLIVVPVAFAGHGHGAEGLTAAAAGVVVASLVSVYPLQGLYFTIEAMCGHLYMNSRKERISGSAAVRRSEALGGGGPLMGLPTNAIGLVFQRGLAMALAGCLAAQLLLYFAAAPFLRLLLGGGQDSSLAEATIDFVAWMPLYCLCTAAWAPLAKLLTAAGRPAVPLLGSLCGLATAVAWQSAVAALADADASDAVAAATTPPAVDVRPVAVGMGAAAFAQLAATAAIAFWVPSFNAPRSQPRAQRAALVAALAPLRIREALSPAGIAAMGRAALPAAVLITLEAASYDATVLMAAALGAGPGAAWAALLLAEYVVSAAAAGLSAAACAKVGAALGANQPINAKTYAWTALGMAVAYALAVSVPLFGAFSSGDALGRVAGWEDGPSSSGVAAAELVVSIPPQMHSGATTSEVSAKRKATRKEKGNSGGPLLSAPPAIKATHVDASPQHIAATWRPADARAAAEGRRLAPLFPLLTALDLFESTGQGIVSGARAGHLGAPVFAVALWGVGLPMAALLSSGAGLRLASGEWGGGASLAAVGPIDATTTEEGGTVPSVVASEPPPSPSTEEVDPKAAEEADEVTLHLTIASLKSPPSATAAHAAESSKEKKHHRALPSVVASLLSALTGTTGIAVGFCAGLVIVCAVLFAAVRRMDWVGAAFRLQVAGPEGDDDDEDESEEEGEEEEDEEEEDEEEEEESGEDEEEGDEESHFAASASDPALPAAASFGGGYVYPSSPSQAAAKSCSLRTALSRSNAAAEEEARIAGVLSSRLASPLRLPDGADHWEMIVPAAGGGGGVGGEGVRYSSPFPRMPALRHGGAACRPTDFVAVHK